MDKKWMIMYQLIDDIYEPVQFGSDIVPMTNIDKVVQVPQEIARQATKFDFDGTSLTRKKDFYVLTLEELKEKDRREEIELYGGTPPHESEQTSINETPINF